MRKVSVMRAAGLGAAVLTGVGGLSGLAATAASAAPTTDVTIVGSQTTQELMGAVASAYNAKSKTTLATNIYAQPPDPGTTAPSDASCNGGTAITYISEGNPGANQRTAPNGSSAGRTALATSVQNGDSCVSVARSTSTPSASDPAGTQAYAFAVDAISWVSASTGNSPTNLSITQLAGIYDCQYTNWDQVGGTNAPIARYYPQSGSGIATFFAGVLGFDPRVLGGTNACTTLPTEVEQNSGAAVTPADVPNAIDIYSAGAWIAQANGVDPDLRNGFVVRPINGKPNPVSGTAAPYKVNIKLVLEKNVEPVQFRVGDDTAVQGVNNLFNFINTNSIDYAAAKSVVGTGSLLCTNKDKTLVTKYGFNPLSKCLLVPEP